MQNKPSNDQHKNIYYRLRRSDPSASVRGCGILALARRYFL